MMLVNQKELANVLGITTRRVRQIREEGLFEYAENSKKYNLAKCVQEYIDFKTKKEIGTGTSIIYDREHAEHEKVKKETAKIKLRMLKRELHESSDVENFLSDMLINFKNRLLSIPSKLAVQLQGEGDINRIKRILNDEMLQTLDTLSEYSLDDVGDAVMMDEEEDEEE